MLVLISSGVLAICAIGFGVALYAFSDPVQGVSSLDPSGTPVVSSGDDGSFVLVLTDVRYYEGNRWERYYKEHYPAPGMMFIYPDVIVRNASDNDITFTPTTQFWLEDSVGRLFDFSIGFGYPESREEAVSFPEPPAEPMITLAAGSEILIFLETEINQDSVDVSLYFDPDPLVAGDEVVVGLP